MSQQAHRHLRIGLVMAAGIGIAAGITLRPSVTQVPRLQAQESGPSGQERLQQLQDRYEPAIGETDAALRASLLATLAADIRSDLSAGSTFNPQQQLAARQLLVGVLFQSGDSTDALSELSPYLDAVVSQEGDGMAQVAARRLAEDAQAQRQFDLAEALYGVIQARWSQESVAAYLYDKSWRVTKRTQAPLGINLATEYQYNADGNLTRTKFTSGSTSAYGAELVYDAPHRVTKNSFGGRDTRVYFDDMSRITKHEIGASTPGWHTTTLSYDGLGRLTHALSPLGHYATMEYDAADNLTRQLAYQEDGANANTSLDWLLDADGNLTKLTDNILSKTITYEYDLDDLRTKLDGPEANDTQVFVYEPNTHRLTKITENGSDRAVFEYNMVPAQITKVTYGSGAYQEWGYDNAARLTSLFHKRSSGSPTTIASFQYDLDNAGNRTKLTLKDGDYLELLHDARDQLTKEVRKNSGGAETYSNAFYYDRKGNRTKLEADDDGAGSNPSVTTTYAYSSFDELTKSTTSGADTTYLYSADGNLTRTTAGGSNYDWYYDARNLLTKYDDPTAANDATYDLDSLCRRAKVTVNGSTVGKFLYDGLNVLAEYDDSMSPHKASYVNAGLDRYVSVTRGGSLYYYHQDPLGSVWAITDTSANQTAQNSYQYAAFGATYSTVTEGIANPYRFTGRNWDGHSSTHHYRARQYGQTVGRFLSHDPIGLHGGSANLFAYVANNPLRFTDPLGAQTDGHVRLPDNGDNNGGNLGGGTGDTGGEFAGDPNVPPGESGGGSNISPGISIGGSPNVSPGRDFSSPTGNLSPNEIGQSSSSAGQWNGVTLSPNWSGVSPFGGALLEDQQLFSLEMMRIYIPSFWELLENKDWLASAANLSQGFARGVPGMGKLLDDVGNGLVYDPNSGEAKAGGWGYTFLTLGLGCGWTRALAVADAAEAMYDGEPLRFFASVAMGLLAPCFPAGTQVLVADTDGHSDQPTTKNIEDVAVGDMIVSRNTEENRSYEARVTKVFKQVSDHLRIVRIRSPDGHIQELKTTDEHPFYVAERGWVPAGRLAHGDKLVQADGQLAIVESTRYERHLHGVAVFNFEVEASHSYFVASAEDCHAVLVHNMCLWPGGRPPGLTTLQSNKKIILARTAKALGLTREAAHAAMEKLKKAWLIPPDVHHHRIMSDGSVYDFAWIFLGNLKD